MNKFLISTPGRTASTSFFNYLEQSLRIVSDNIITVDRGQYTDDEWSRFNSATCAAFTTFNPFHFANILERINPKEWCLIVLSRRDFAGWLLSINALNATNKWHPGKEYSAEKLTFEQDTFMSSYWYYKCWQRLVYNQADTFNFGRVIRIDFTDLIADWTTTGQLVNGWDWKPNNNLMRLGMTTSWASVTNLADVLTWIPDQCIIEEIKNSI
jgi:hypothetical protein